MHRRVGLEGEGRRHGHFNEGLVVRRRRWDASRPGKYAGPNPVPITASDIRAALDALVEGRDVPQAPGSIGCNIKWAPGSEPHYFKPGGMAK